MYNISYCFLLQYNTATRAISSATNVGELRTSLDALGRVSVVKDIVPTVLPHSSFSKATVLLSLTVLWLWDFANATVIMMENVLEI